MITHDRERGSMMVSTLIGSVLAALVLGGFAVFTTTANEAGREFAQRSIEHSEMTVVRDRLVRDLDTAGLPVALTATTATAPRPGGEVVRYSITGGALSVQYGTAETTNWATVPTTVRLTGLGELSGFSLESEGLTGALVRVVLDLPGGDPADPEVNTPILVGAGVDA